MRAPPNGAATQFARCGEAPALRRQLGDAQGGRRGLGPEGGVFIQALPYHIERPAAIFQ
jgi:hypothetical protein